MKATPGVMRIGEVHAELRKVFPTVELSKIRYYEDKGLVQPSRSRKGYRLYSERDVECFAKRFDWPKRSLCHFAWCVFA